MNFASFPYLVFLAVCVFIYFLLNNRAKPYFLLLASYLFYAFFGLGFVALMFVTSLITYATSYYCYHAETEQKRKLFFFLGLFFDLAVFIVFKYLHPIDADIMNWPNWSAYKILIPIGISFYTFKTIGYCVDMYKRKYEPEPQFVFYALSVGFFPQLIAGPIEKTVVISERLKANTNFNFQNCIEGGKLILWGLFKKIVISDSIAQLINPVFNNLREYSGIDLIIVFTLFGYQIYTDFSGYSDIAIGSAKCFGVDLPANFNKPYLSKNYREFWLRWHATFSKWLKEYVFAPMGGVSRNSRAKTVFNLFILFLVVGFWHGATLNFLLYAQLAFVLILIDIITKDARKRLLGFLKISRTALVVKLFSYAAMAFLLMSLAVFYRLADFDDSLYSIKNLFHFGDGSKLKAANIALAAAYILALEFFQSFQETADGSCFQKVRNVYLRFAMYLIVLFAILLMHSRPEVTFQYFQI
jgi:alginate O-acetyltransferase complex protein AlgI